MEGDVGSSHLRVSCTAASTANPSQGAAPNPNTFADKMPRWFPQETNYGLMLSPAAQPPTRSLPVARQPVPHAVCHARRRAARRRRSCIKCTCRSTSKPRCGLRCYVRPERPLTPGGDRTVTRTAGSSFGDRASGTFETVENAENDYRIDRAEQSVRAPTWASNRSWRKIWRRRPRPRWPRRSPIAAASTAGEARSRHHHAAQAVS